MSVTKSATIDSSENYSPSDDSDVSEVSEVSDASDVSDVSDASEVDSVVEATSSEVQQPSISSSSNTSISN